MTMHRYLMEAVAEGRCFQAMNGKVVTIPDNAACQHVRKRAMNDPKAAEDPYRRCGAPDPMNLVTVVDPTYPVQGALAICDDCLEDRIKAMNPTIKIVISKLIEF